VVAFKRLLDLGSRVSQPPPDGDQLVGQLSDLLLDRLDHFDAERHLGDVTGKRLDNVTTPLVYRTTSAAKCCTSTTQRSRG